MNISNGSTNPDQTQVPTPDGRPTPLSALNTETPSVLAKSGQGVLQRIASFYQKLNQVMAGMYTGVGCSGTPHSHHTYSKKRK